MDHILTIRDGISTPGSARPNEDTFAWLPQAAWVLDGVSGLEPSVISGEAAPRWFVRRFSTALSRQMIERPGLDTLALINSAIQDCISLWSKLDVRNSVHPAATFAMVRLIDEKVELSTIGDCSIRYSTQVEDITVFGDRSVEPFENRTLDRLRTLQKEHPTLPHDELVKRVRATQSNNRHYLNKPDGYNALTLSPIAPRNLISQSLEVTERQDFLLTSDGFSRYTDVFAMSSEAQFFHATDTHGLAYLLRQIRSRETGDMECRLFPRMKVSDDATALHVRVQRAS